MITWQKIYLELREAQCTVTSATHDGIDAADFADGFDWVFAQIEDQLHDDLAAQLRLEKNIETPVDKGILFRLDSAPSTNQGKNR